MQPIDPHLPTHVIESMLPADELDALSAYGDTHDDLRWMIGDTARRWVDDCGMPVMQICVIVGKRTDYGPERVRKCLYTSRYYHTRPELRERYNVLRYSVFEHAWQCSDPESVLMDAMQGQLTPGQVKFTRPMWAEEIRALMASVPKHRQAEAKAILAIAFAKIRELLEDA